MSLFMTPGKLDPKDAEIERLKRERKSLIKLVHDLSQGLEDSRRMVLYDDEYSKLQERAGEVTK